LNSLTIKSPLIGVPSSLVVLFTISIAASEIFFSNEKRFLKQVLGLATALVMTALLGVFLILVARFTETLSLASFVVVGLMLFLFSVLRKRTGTRKVSEQLHGHESRKRESYFLVFPFLLSTAIAFYALLLARTGEGVMSVWLTIPTFFLPIFFLSSLSLMALLLLTEIGVGLKLAFVSLHSFLSHSLFLIVWYPNRYGDPWLHLGEARFIDKFGTFYAYDWLMSQRLVADIVKYKSQYALVVLFERMFSLDIYWVQVFFIPVLWSLLMPVFSFKLAELLAAKKTKAFPLLAAVSVGFFTPLIYWGAISAPNSLGFLFLFFSMMLVLYGDNTHDKRVWILALLASIATFFAHPITGIFVFVFILGAATIQSKLHSILKAVLLIVFSAAYPYASYLQGATFVLGGLLNLENVSSFQVDVTTVLLAFAFLGLVFSLRGRLVKGRSALMLFLFYIITVVDYYIVMYGMQNSAVPDRLLPLMSLLLVPFAASGLLIITRFFKAGLSRVNSHPLIRLVTPHSVAVFMICLFLSLQVTLALFQTYPRNEITEVQPAAYEVEAVYYVDSAAEGRYVVLGDTNLAGIAAGLLGIDYTYGSHSKGAFGVPEWTWWSMKLYAKMGRNPSLSVLEEAMFTQKVGIAYFVVSVRDPAYYEIVEQTSEVLAVDRVFGDGKLTVFKHVSGIIPIGGDGPNVKVTFDDGTSAEVQTQYNYFVKSYVTYTLVGLSGHSSYNVTAFPSYWTFSDIFVDGDSRQVGMLSDLNTFIYLAGLATNEQVDVLWQANDYYPVGGWKEDSFKRNWHTHTLYPGTISPNITTDGNILSLSWDFTPHSGAYTYYYYAKDVNVSTNDYRYILVRWRSIGRASAVYFAYADDPAFMYPVVPFGSENADWTVTIVELEPNKEVAYVMVGLTNLASPNFDLVGLQALEIDYILIGAQV
jgi:hypothetical protein